MSKKDNRELPQYVTGELARNGLSIPGAEMSAFSDMRGSGMFGETWLLIIDSDFVVLDVANPPLAPLKHRTKKGRTRRKAEKVFRRVFPAKTDPASLPIGFSIALAARYPLDAVERLETEELVTGGLLVANIYGQERMLCRFTASTVGQIKKFTEIFGEIKGSHTRAETADEAEKETCPHCGRPYTDPVRRFCKRCLNKRALFMRVLGYVPRYGGALFLILACMLASSALSLLGPYIGGSVFFDQVLSEKGKYHGQVTLAVLVLAGAQLLSLILSICYGRINAKLTSQVVYDLKTEVFTALQRLSLGFYSQKQTGSLITGVNDNAMQLQYFFHDGLPYLIVNLISLAGIAAVMLFMNAKMALLVMIPVPLVIPAIRKLFPRIWTLLSRKFRAISSMQALLNDNLTGVRVVKAFGKEQSEIGRFSASSEIVRSADLQYGTINAVAVPAMGFVMGIGGLIVWAAGSLEVVAGTMTIGMLLTFTGYIAMIYQRLEFLTHVIDWWSSSMNAAHRIFEILDAVPDVVEHAKPRNVKIRGAVKLDKVTFGYEPLHPVLHEIDLDINAGEMIGLVGHSGAGKSTLINLITRLYDVQEGAISIDGVPIKEIAISDLRHQVGMVLQETFLFAGTIAENIAYARPEATKREIMNAARIANAHDFIATLPDGYDTVLGKRGYAVSGGERQRIAIARAVLHDPAILILDEATASVDTETESLIQDALARLVKGRTTLAIAHRLSTLRNADRIVVVKKGRIVETGPHEKLMEAQGAYFAMMQIQREALKVTGAVQ